jgi:hypothetical protein
MRMTVRRVCVAVVMVDIVAELLWIVNVGGCNPAVPVHNTVIIMCMTGGRTTGTCG